MTSEMSEERLDHELLRFLAMEADRAVARADPPLEIAYRVAERTRRRSRFEFRRTGLRHGVAAGVLVALAALAVAVTLLRPSEEPTVGGSPVPRDAPGVGRPSAPSMTPAAPPGSTPFRSPAATTFSSPRLGYTVDLTTDWSVTTVPGTWTGATDATHRSGDPGTDFFTNPHGAQAIEIGTLPVPSGTTLPQWVATEGPKTHLLGCSMGTASASRAIGGKSVVLLRESCPLWTVVNALLVQGRLGILVQWVAWPNGADARSGGEAEFMRILGSLAVR